MAHLYADFTFFFLPIIDPCFLLVYFNLFCAFPYKVATILILIFRPITKTNKQKKDKKIKNKKN